MAIFDIAEKYSDYIIQTRRKFHRYPETALKEAHTCAMICEELKGMGLEPRVIADTGVMVDIGSKMKGPKTVAIRSDIDALPIQEETGAPFASENEGCSHACGHDAHIAMNLGCARVLSEIKDEINGTVRLLFQPAEETALGSLKMIDAGALDGVDNIYGTHVWGTIPAGKFSIAPGIRMAATNFFTLTVRGKSTHGSLPHEGVDPIAAAAAIINNVQVAVHREIPATIPAVVSFCQIHGGNADNAIPETVTIGGTTRTFSTDVQKEFPRIIGRVASETAKAFRAEITLDFDPGSPAVINDEASAALAVRAVRENFGDDAFTDFGPIMSGEDFSEYLLRVPGVYVFLGIENEACGAVYPNHSSHFAMDESVLIRGTTAAVQYALDYLEGA